MLEITTVMNKEPDILRFLFLLLSVSIGAGNTTPDISGTTVVRIVEVLYTGICFGRICYQYTGTRTFNQREQKLA